MSEQFICWKCGAKLLDVILPMSRREECSQCHCDQHVCKMCVYYDSASRISCLEEHAEYIADRERANFCDYFSPSNAAFNASARQKQQQAKARLAALFDDEQTQMGPSLWENPNQPSPDKPLTPSEIAEQKLRKLLGE
ncbi:MAG: hypothetical protein ACJA13_003065 [Paraglaciecola sp.]|jgi:hypothetical protein